MAIAGERIYSCISMLGQESHMKTIHPIGLARLIATHQPFDLIDIPTKKIDKAHFPGARWIPLQKIRPSKVLFAITNCRRQSRCMSFAEVVGAGWPC